MGFPYRRAEVTNELLDRTTRHPINMAKVLLRMPRRVLCD